MKKLIVLVIAMSLYIIGSGSAFADEPEINAWGRYAIWTNWIDNKADPLFGNKGGMDIAPYAKQKGSSNALDKSAMTNSIAEFDFVQETMSYDHEKDQGNSV